MKIKYTGELTQRDLWGVTFEKGKAVDVDDALAHKALCVGDFEKVRGRPKKAADNGENEQ